MNSTDPDQTLPKMPDTEVWLVPGLCSNISKCKDSDNENHTIYIEKELPRTSESKFFKIKSLLLKNL